MADLLTRVAESARTHPGIARAVCLVLCFVVLFSLYLRLALSVAPNSDDAAFVLEARDLLRGNILLHGWTLPLDSFYTLIVPLYALGALFIRHASLLMCVVPAATYALLVVFCIAIVWTQVVPESRTAGVLIILLLIGCPAFLSGPPNESGGDHITTVLFLTAAFYLVAADRFAPAAAFLLLADIGDPLAIWIGNISVAMVGLWLIPHQSKRALRLLAVAVGCLLLSKLTLAGISHFHGYTIVAGETRSVFVPLARLGSNFYLFVESILELFGANFFGRDVTNPETLLILVHFAGLVFLVWAIIRLIRNASAARRGTMAMLLMTATIVDVAAFIFSASPVDLASARYLSPALVYGSLLTALSWSDLAVARKYVEYLLPVIVFGYALAFGIRLTHPRAPQPAAVLDYLESNGLSEGYGEYWSSGILTALSDGKVKVRQVIAGPGGRLIPYDWLSTRDWYNMTDARFFIFRGQDGGTNFNALRTWGTPQQTTTIDGYRIMIWSAPIQLPPK
jgi:hypothetical protein